MFGRKRRKARREREAADAAAEAARSAIAAPTLAPPPTHRSAVEPEPSLDPEAVEGAHQDDAAPAAPVEPAADRGLAAVLTDGARLGFEPELHVPDTDED